MLCTPARGAWHCWCLPSGCVYMWMSLTWHTSSLCTASSPGSKQPTRAKGCCMEVQSAVIWRSCCWAACGLPRLVVDSAATPPPSWLRLPHAAGLSCRNPSARFLSYLEALIQVFISEEEFTSQVARSFPAVWLYVAVVVMTLEAPVK